MHNTGFVKVAVKSFAGTFVQGSTFVLRINICGKIATFAKPQNVDSNAKVPTVLRFD
jgi:hypothetical protein